MTSIRVTLPKSAGGLKHLEQKIGYVNDEWPYEQGYAWWWVTKANELTPDDFVEIVCEGRLRGAFSIKWIVDKVMVNPSSDEARVEFRDSDGALLLREVNSEYRLLRATERIDESTDWQECTDLSQDDIAMLLDVDEYYQEGKQTIFFKDWFPSLEQPDMKGFQGFRYVRR